MSLFDFIFTLILVMLLAGALARSQETESPLPMTATPVATKNPTKPHHHYDIRHQPKAKIHNPTDVPDPQETPNGGSIQQ